MSCFDIARSRSAVTHCSSAHRAAARMYSQPSVLTVCVQQGPRRANASILDLSAQSCDVDRSQIKMKWAYLKLQSGAAIWSWGQWAWGRLTGGTYLPRGSVTLPPLYSGTENHSSHSWVFDVSFLSAVVSFIRSIIFWDRQTQPNHKNLFLFDFTFYCKVLSCLYFNLSMLQLALFQLERCLLFLPQDSFALFLHLALVFWKYDVRKHSTLCLAVML